LPLAIAEAVGPRWRSEPYRIRLLPRRHCPVGMARRSPPHQPRQSRL